MLYSEAQLKFLIASRSPSNQFARLFESQLLIASLGHACAKLTTIKTPRRETPSRQEADLEGERGRPVRQAEATRQARQKQAGQRLLQARDRGPDPEARGKARLGGWA